LIINQDTLFDYSKNDYRSDLRLIISDLSGNALKTVALSSAEKESKVNISGLSSSCYWLWLIENGSIIASTKIVKLK